MKNNDLGRDVVSVGGLKKEKKCTFEDHILSPMEGSVGLPRLEGTYD